MNSTLFDFGIIQIKWYSFFLFLAMIIAFFIIKKEGKKKEIKEEDIIDFLFYGIIIGLLGARIYYILFNLNYYLKNPIEMIQVWNGGLAIHGGIIAGIVFLFYYSKKKKINFILLLDIIVVGLIIAQSIGRWGNFFNQEAYGRTISLALLKKYHIPNFIIQGMYINDSYKEPTFLYESILSFIIRKRKNIKTGQLTGMYLLWYGIERLFIEQFRSDSLMLGPIKIAQLVSIILIIIGIYLFQMNKKNNRFYHKEKIYIDK